MAVTIKDVAAAAGVSTATVSHVFNATRFVAPETAERVREAAKQLGLKTLGLAGGSGGKLKEACDACVVVPGNCPADVQEYHLPVYHALCAMLESELF